MEGTLPICSSTIPDMFPCSFLWIFKKAKALVVSVHEVTWNIGLGASTEKESSCGLGLCLI